MSRLDELCHLITDGKHGDCVNSENSGYYFISCKDVKDGWIDYTNARQITEEDYLDVHKRTQLEGNDIVITNSGTIGRMALVKFKPETKRTAFQKSVAILKPDATKVVPSWLYYCLNSNVAQLISMSGGTAQKNLLLSDLRAFEINVPHIKLQHKIASVLSAYDDLIENNTLRIKILEEMAQNLYREWFVKLRFPGHEKVKKVESELRIIPEGWKINNIGSLMSHTIGGGWGEESQSEKFSMPAYVIRGTDIPNARHGSIESCPLRYHTESNLRSRRHEAGDIVFEVSGGSKGQPVGRALLINQNLLDSFDNDVICASFCKLIRPDKNVIIPELIYLYLLEIYANGVIEKYQVQSTGITNFKYEFFLQSEMILVPEKEVQQIFADNIKPIFDLIHKLGAKNTNLRRTRDLLLPKLISGELNVENLDIDTGGAE